MNQIDEIYLARNRFKRRYLQYNYEAIRNIGEKLSKEILGKKSFSLFGFVCIAYVLGLLKYKLDIFNEEDKRYIKELYVLLSTKK